ncbi:uncharacterized protein LOC144048805 isoform X2 [Vanacampus margaritifer]
MKRTMASYENQICRVSDNNERQRRQLDAAQTDVRQLSGGQFDLLNLQLAHIKEEEEEEADVSKLARAGVSVTSDSGPHPLRIKKEEEDAEQEMDVNKLPVIVVSVKSDDDEGDHCSPSRGPPPDNLLSPLSDSDNMEEPLRDDKQSKCAKKETTLTEKNSQTRRRCHTPDGHFSCSICVCPHRCQQYHRSNGLTEIISDQ